MGVRRAVSWSVVSLVVLVLGISAGAAARAVRNRPTDPVQQQVSVLAERCLAQLVQQGELRIAAKECSSLIRSNLPELVDSYRQAGREFNEARVTLREILEEIYQDYTLAEFVEENRRPRDPSTYLTMIRVQVAGENRDAIVDLWQWEGLFTAYRFGFGPRACLKSLLFDLGNDQRW